MKHLKKDSPLAGDLNSESLFYFLLAGLLLVVMMLPFIPALTISIILVMARIQLNKKIQMYAKSRQRLITFLLISIPVFITLFLIRSTQDLYLNISSMNLTDGKNLIKSLVGQKLSPLHDQAVRFFSNFSSTKEANTFIDEKLKSIFSSGAETITSLVFSFFTSLPDTLLLLGFATIAYFLIKKNYHDLKSKSLVNIPSGHLRTKVKSLWRIAENSAFSAVVSTISVSLAQGLVVGVGALSAGIEIWPLYVVLGFIFSFFPVIGLIPVLLLGTIQAYVSLGFGPMLIFLCVGLLSTLTDNLLRTLFMSKDSDNIHSFISFFSLIGAMYVFGLTGLIVGPFLFSMSSNLLKEADKLNAGEKIQPIE